MLTLITGILGQIALLFLPVAIIRVTYPDPQVEPVRGTFARNFAAYPSRHDVPRRPHG